MPTFNQLVRQGRSEKVYKSKAPVLQKGFNTLNNAPTDQHAPQKRGYSIEYIQKRRAVDGKINY